MGFLGAIEMTSPVASDDRADDVLIIGAGPAGLTAGYVLTRDSDLSVRILEAHPTLVGGISRTETHQDCLIDIGGHRFFTKSREVEALWREILPRDFLPRPRLSRIHYRGKLYGYPLRAMQAMWNLGPIESSLCLFSYLRARLRPIEPALTFADWVTNHFGARLFRMFFKSYTEKVWGMSCDAISADWAAQRIKGLDLGQAIWSGMRRSLGLGAAKSGTIKTLTESFHYPRRGPGMMWQEAAARIGSQSGQIEHGLTVSALTWDAERKLWTVTATDAAGALHEFRARRIVSSAPMSELVPAVRPLPETASLASRLKYRGFLMVAIVLDAPPGFADNWIYIHDPELTVGRIQNFAAWSDEMVPAGKSCLGLEYFCAEGGPLWNLDDEALVALASRELAALGLADTAQIRSGRVIRQPKAYPVYDAHYRHIVAAVRAEFAERYPTLHFVGRNGMHKYDNQDHAMMTAMLTAANILAGYEKFDVWQVNEDAEYHEEQGEQVSGASGLRAVPSLVAGE
jgi:protoporphyrinogen oxidase